jgi:hypothetical protein
VEAWVEVDGSPKLMVFITNNSEWSSNTVCDLYRARWEIEVFFKQVKQTLKLSGFVGYSANAIRWQVWTALLLYVLLRFVAHLSKWAHSFTRLFSVVRASMWERLDLLSLLKPVFYSRQISSIHNQWFATAIILLALHFCRCEGFRVAP